jgi:uracil phosphoribosyltransferase
MCEAMLELFPAAHVYYLGLFREKVTLQPVECRDSSFSLASTLSTAKRP